MLKARISSFLVMSSILFVRWRRSPYEPGAKGHDASPETFVCAHQALHHSQSLSATCQQNVKCFAFRVIAINDVDKVETIVPNVRSLLRQRQPGGFVLTGSFSTSPAPCLVGRCVVLSLTPADQT